MVSPTTAQLPPRGRADCPPLTNRADGHRNLYPALPPTSHQGVTNALRARAPIRRTTISAAPNPAPARLVDLLSIIASSRA